MVFVCTHILGPYNALLCVLILHIYVYSTDRSSGQARRHVKKPAADLDMIAGTFM